MEYWIIIDNKHAGPYSASQLIDAGLTPDTLVWHEGLTDWVKAATVAELASAMQQSQLAEAEALSESEVEAAEDSATAEAYCGYGNGPQTCDQNPQAPDQWQQQCDLQASAQAGQMIAQPCSEPCPPAYIAWSVIVTVLCCTIIGVPAIIFSSMTKSAYYRGDLQKAKRYSEMAQWFIIASIVCGVVGLPFQAIFMGMF